jgi:hypothetical protein
LNIFSKEKALYLADNPRKMGFSWLFVFAGIVVGFVMYLLYGDSRFVIMVVEKYIFIMFSLLFIGIRTLIERRIKSELMPRASKVVYLTLPAGYVFTFFLALWATHFTLATFAD